MGGGRQHLLCKVLRKAWHRKLDAQAGLDVCRGCTCSHCTVICDVIHQAVYTLPEVSEHVTMSHVHILRHQCFKCLALDYTANGESVA